MKLQPPPKLLMDIEKALAKQRQRSGTQVPLTSNDVKGEKGFQPVLPSPEGSIGEVVDKVAKVVGVSGATFERAKAVMDSKPSEEAKDKTTFTRTRFYRIFLVDILLLHHMLGCRSLS